MTIYEMYVQNLLNNLKTAQKADKAVLVANVISKVNNIDVAIDLLEKFNEFSARCPYLRIILNDLNKLKSFNYFIRTIIDRVNEYNMAARRLTKMFVNGMCPEIFLAGYRELNVLMSTAKEFKLWDEQLIQFKSMRDLPNNFFGAYLNIEDLIYRSVNMTSLGKGDKRFLTQEISHNFTWYNFDLLGVPTQYKVDQDSKEAEYQSEEEEEE